MSLSDILYLNSALNKLPNSLNRIKQVLDEKQLTQVQLSEMIGKSFESVNAYCSNRRQPSLELLYEISKVLGCSVKDLIIDNKPTTK